MNANLIEKTSILPAPKDPQFQIAKDAPDTPDLSYRGPTWNRAKRKTDMRVVHFTQTFLPRGETFIYGQLRHLPPEKAVALSREERYREYFPGINLHSFNRQTGGLRKYWADFNYQTLRRMSGPERRFYGNVIRSEKADLLHVHFAANAEYFLDVVKDTNLPLIVSCYGYDVASFPNPRAGLGVRSLQPVWEHARLVLAASDDMRSDLIALGCPEHKILVHYHGIELSRFKFVERSAKEKTIRILFVGSLADRKGAEDVLLAFSQIAPYRPRLELRLVGTGDMESGLRKSVQELGLENRVSFAGFVRHEELPGEFEKAQILCHPNRDLKDGDKEGIPGTVVEAMATGLPVIATRQAGIPSIVRNGEDGFIVSERDLRGVGKAILTLTDYPFLRLFMGRNAGVQARRHADVTRRTIELDSIYREIAAPKGNA